MFLHTSWTVHTAIMRVWAPVFMFSKTHQFNWSKNYFRCDLTNAPATLNRLMHWGSPDEAWRLQQCRGWALQSVETQQNVHPKNYIFGLIWPMHQQHLSTEITGARLTEPAHPAVPWMSSPAGFVRCATPTLSHAPVQAVWQWCGWYLLSE